MITDMTDHDSSPFIMNIGIVGDHHIGKKHLIFRFTQDKFGVFMPQVWTATGPDFEERVIQVNGEEIHVRLLHMYGSEKFRALGPSYFRRSMGLAICYAVNTRESFNNVESWIEDATMVSNEKVGMVLVSTKCDIEDRCVQYEEGSQLAEKYGIKFFETSAREGIYVEEVFYELAVQAKKAFGETAKKVILIGTEEEEISKGPQTCC